jgi:hypothetical protein
LNHPITDLGIPPDSQRRETALTAERHAEIRRKLDLLDISETDPGAAAEALTGVDLGPKGRG